MYKEIPCEVEMKLSEESIFAIEKLVKEHYEEHIDNKHLDATDCILKAQQSPSDDDEIAEYKSDCSTIDEEDAHAHDSY